MICVDARHQNRSTDEIHCETNQSINQLGSGETSVCTQPRRRPFFRQAEAFFHNVDAITVETVDEDDDALPGSIPIQVFTYLRFLEVNDLDKKPASGAWLRWCIPLSHLLNCPLDVGHREPSKSSHE